jgi:hypothetical protein
VKVLIKLIVTGLILNALWRVGAAYASFYEFKDAVRAAAMDPAKSEDDLRQKIVELASSYDVPVAADAIEIHRESQHTVVETAYTAPVALLPGYVYPWRFNVDVDAVGTAVRVAP